MERRLFPLLRATQHPFARKDRDVSVFLRAPPRSCDPRANWTGYIAPRQEIKGVEEDRLSASNVETGSIEHASLDFTIHRGDLRSPDEIDDQLGEIYIYRPHEIFVECVFEQMRNVMRVLRLYCREGRHTRRFLRLSWKRTGFVIPPTFNCESMLFR